MFAPEVLRAQPSAETRLKRLARIPPRPPLPHEARTDENDDTIRKLRDMAVELAGRFRLRYRSIEPEQDGVNEHYGICYADGLIRIRLRHAVTGRLLKESSLVDTLCHELAHLKHFDHSPRFWRFYRRVLAEARDRGWYRPGPARARAWQGTLFSAPDGAAIARSDDA